FSDDEAGNVECNAVAAFLASLGGPLQADSKRANPKQQQASLARGQRLFTSTGCVACHTLDKDPRRSELAAEPSFLPRPVSFVLTGLGSKTTPAQLAAYLVDPGGVDPSGRMPHMLLQPTEARDLASYLCQSRDATIDANRPAAPAREQLLAAFRRLDN